MTPTKSLGGEKYVSPSSEIPERPAVQEDPVSVNPTRRNAFSLANLDKTFSLKTPTKLLVTSSGPSAEFQGSRLGIYKKAGTHKNCPYYKQVDTERSDGKEEVIYRHKEGGWTIGPGLDGGYAMKNASKTESVPLTGWTYWAIDKNLNDPHLRISPD